MSLLREAFSGILAAAATSLLVFGAITLTITEGMVMSPAAELSTQTTAPTEAIFPDFPGFVTATSRPTIRPTARLVAATTVAPTSTCPIMVGWERYTILPGDTVQSIATARGISPEALMEKNCLMSSQLQAGWLLFLPPLPPTATASATLTPVLSVTPTSCVPPADWVRYVVQSGDTLFKISAMYGVRVYELQVANCLGPTTMIYPRDVLYVPNVTPRYTATPQPTQVPPTAIPPTARPATAVPKTATLTPPVIATPERPPVISPDVRTVTVQPTLPRPSAPAAP